MAILKKAPARSLASSPCTDQHCGAVSCGVNCTCKKNCWTVGHKVLVCDEEGNCCDCTCSCLLFDTPVQVPNGTEAIQQIEIGSMVVAYDTNFTSRPMTVNFSDGTDGAVDQPLMVYVHLGAGAPLVVTGDHVFLVAGPQAPLLKRAFDLTPEDLLLSPEGEPVSIEQLETKPARGGIWNIATVLEAPKSPDGHLLNTQGVLSGDYALQLFLDEMPPTFSAAARKKSPKAARLGTEEYAAKYKVKQKERPIGDWLLPYTGGKGIRLSGASAGARAAKDGAQTMLLNTSSTETVSIPRDHASFLTDVQALRVRLKVPKRPYDDPMMIDGTRYLFTLANAFYPDLNFVIDWSSHRANAYAARELGRSWIIIQGGLLRAVPVGFEGTSLIISHLISRFMPSQPRTRFDYACTGEADYTAVSAVMRQLWFDQLFPKSTVPGIKQLEELFKAIGGYTKAGRKEGKCIQPSLQCRIQTYRAGLALVGPPPCAGGPAVKRSKKAFGNQAAVAGCPPCDAPECPKE